MSGAVVTRVDDVTLSGGKEAVARIRTEVEIQSGYQTFVIVRGDGNNLDESVDGPADGSAENIFQEVQSNEDALERLCELMTIVGPFLGRGTTSEGIGGGSGSSNTSDASGGGGSSSSSSNQPPALKQEWIKEYYCEVERLLDLSNEHFSGGLSMRTRFMLQGLLDLRTSALHDRAGMFGTSALGSLALSVHRQAGLRFDDGQQPL
jgi:hypothetical protein